MKLTLLIAATAIALSAPAVPHAHAWNYTDGSTYWKYSNGRIMRSQDEITEWRMNYKICGDAAFGFAGGPTGRFDRTFGDQLLSYCMHKKGYVEATKESF